MVIDGFRDDNVKLSLAQRKALATEKDVLKGSATGSLSPCAAATCHGYRGRAHGFI